MEHVFFNIGCNLPYVAENTKNLDELVKLLTKYRFIDSKFDYKLIKLQHGTNVYEIAFAVHKSLLTNEHINEDEDTLLRCLNETGNEAISNVLKKKNDIQTKSIIPQVWFDIEPPARHFVGQKNHLENLEKWVLEEKPDKCVLISGDSGMGKSELAKVFAKAFYLTSEGNCMWLSASNNLLQDSFQQLAKNFGQDLNDHFSDEEKLKIFVWEIFSALSNRPCLLIIDDIVNYEDKFLNLLIEKYILWNDHYLVITSRCIPINSYFKFKEIKLINLSNLDVRNYFSKIFNLPTVDFKPKCSDKSQLDRENNERMAESIKRLENEVETAMRRHKQELAILEQEIGPTEDFVIRLDKIKDKIFSLFLAECENEPDDIMHEFLGKINSGLTEQRTIAIKAFGQRQKQFSQSSVENKIKENLVVISERLTNTHTVLLHLVEKNILSFQELDGIKSKTQFEGNSELFLCLIKKNMDSIWEPLKSILLSTRNMHIVQILEPNDFGLSDHHAFSISMPVRETQNFDEIVNLYSDFILHTEMDYFKDIYANTTFHIDGNERDPPIYLKGIGFAGRPSQRTESITMRLKIIQSASYQPNPTPLSEIETTYTAEANKITMIDLNKSVRMLRNSPCEVCIWPIAGGVVWWANPKRDIVFYDKRNKKQIKLTLSVPDSAVYSLKFSTDE